MKKLIVLLVVLVLVPIMAAVLFKRVPPATIGVKQSQWGGGIIQDDYSTGFHLGISYQTSLINSNSIAAL